jgi:uncharacterized protein
LNAQLPNFLEIFQIGDAPPEPFHPSGEILSGAPVGLTRNSYESANGRKLVGLWESSAGAWRVAYTEWEYCWILEGRVRIIGSDGAVTEAGPGDSLVLHPGFEGVWEVVEPCKKLYVIDLAGA